MTTTNCTDDFMKTNILMEEGDSSLEPGEVKTPPHGNEISKNTLNEAVKCKEIQYLPHFKAESKLETERCAEKVRAILELDAIKRKEELERRKEQKINFDAQILSTDNKKEQKRQKLLKGERKKMALSEFANDGNYNHEATNKKSKDKKRKREETKSYSTHSTTEVCESGVASPMLSAGNFVTPLANISTPFNRGFSAVDNSVNYRPYNSFIRNSRPDIHHNRGDDFVLHNRGRFSRFRSQYYSGPCHMSTDDRGHSSLPLRYNTSLPTLQSQLLWTKTKPSISYAYNLPQDDRNINKKNNKTTEINSLRKKKSKKSKNASEREDHSRDELSPKSSHKLSTRRKIRKIRETLPSQPTKVEILPRTPEIIQLERKDRENINLPSDKNMDYSRNITDAVTKQTELKIELKKCENTVQEVIGDTAPPSAKQEVFDMFASLTPPQQKSPPIDVKRLSNTSTNVQITNKLQEIQDRIGKLLEDDDLKLEAIQATKEKLLQKAKEQTENNNSTKIVSKKSKISLSSANIKGSSPVNLKKPRDKTAEKSRPSQSGKERDFDLKSTNAKLKRKSSPERKQFHTISENTSLLGTFLNDNDLSHVKNSSTQNTKSTPTNCLHSNNLNKHSSDIKSQTKKDILTETKSYANKMPEIEIVKKLMSSIEDSPRILMSSALRTHDSSPDTDDYSDNWENDDEELDMNSAFPNLNRLEASKRELGGRVASSTPPLTFVDSAYSESNSKIQSTTPKNSPPPRAFSNFGPKPAYSDSKSPDNTANDQDSSELQQLYNQFIKSVEKSDPVENVTHVPVADDSRTEIKPELENEHLSTSSASCSSSSTSSSDTSNSSSGSSSSTSSSESASDDSNDTDTVETSQFIENRMRAHSDNKDNTNINLSLNVENKIDESNKINTTESSSNRLSMDREDAVLNSCEREVSNSIRNSISHDSILTTKDTLKPDVAKDLKKLENLEANLLRIQIMRSNYDSADEISDELLKMEKLFLHEKNIILNKYMESSVVKTTKNEPDTQNDVRTPLQSSIESLQAASLSRGQFVQSLQKLQKRDDQSRVSNIFDTNRGVIKLTISPMKLPKTSAIFEADNDVDNSKHSIESCEKDGLMAKVPKPTKEVAIVKPIMECKESLHLHSTHHPKRRRSPLPTYRNQRSRSRSRRGRVRSLSVSPTRNSGGRCTPPHRRSFFSTQSRSRNIERRSRSRSRTPSATRQLSRRTIDISPVSRKRRQFLNTDDRFRKHSSKRDSRSPSSPTSRHRSSYALSPRSSYNCGRFSRSPLPFKPPSPPMNPNLSPRRNSSSPERFQVRRSRSISRSPCKRVVSPPTKPYDIDRHRSLSPKHRFYRQGSPGQTNTSYYFNHSPNRISLDARINIVLNGPSSNHNDLNNGIATYEDYTNYSQYGPAAYMSLPGDTSNFYANQYVPMANAGATLPAIHPMQHTYTNLPVMGSGESELFSPHHGHLNASNFYYNRFGSQPFGVNQPSPLLKELPKATVAVQKGNVLEIVPCSEIHVDNTTEPIPNETEIQVKTNARTDTALTLRKGIANSQMVEEAINQNSESSKRSILKPFEVESDSGRSVFDGTPKRKKVYFEDGVFPNHNSDEEDRKVVEAKIRVKMRRLRKKLGITLPCHKFFAEKSRKEKQNVNFDKRTPPPPPTEFAPTNVEQPIYLRTHTPTPLLYFHFDGVVHSMYVSQMERPIPPRLLNPKCLSSGNISVISHHSDSQSPLYTQSPISAGTTHLHSSKKDHTTSFNRSNRADNISPKIIPSTTTLQHAGSPKINFKIYSPIENMQQTENITCSTLSSTSPNSIKSTIHAIASTALTNHFLQTNVQKRQELPKDVTNTRSMGLLPAPITQGSHPPMAQNTGVTQARIPVIGVSPTTALPKAGPLVSEQFTSGFTPSMMHTQQQQIHNLNHNYLAGTPPPQSHNTHLSSGIQQYFNIPTQRTNRQLPNYLVQQTQPSLCPLSLPICHMVDPLEASHVDLDKFTTPQTMPTPFNFKGP